MSGTPDIQRLIGDVVRFGTIASVDLAAARCTVAVGELETAAVPWIAGRAGDARLWSPPSVGEQVLLLCPEGDIAAGVALCGIYSDANPAPASVAGLMLLRFGDGAILSYDADGHALVARLVPDATAHIVAPGGLTIDGPVTVNGTVTATEDVKTAGVSLKNHVHDKVQAGGAMSGTPVAA
ncbi:phage baseplate assembly protein V [Sphingomonas morindae]|uniref:Phage baseplate assembly protein V n=1 Tax=Sphingomonas morindae TaxID=1541170 RepID=A0ABY4X748_9SPHN|nr:phage baseplate assembly protein V [Sphingomonas morindae]USI72701.1 phage baseplate assembly protein V [Sphingomonas morindae]